MFVIQEFKDHQQKVKHSTVNVELFFSGKIECCLEVSFLIEETVFAGAWPVLIDDFVEYAKPKIQGPRSTTV